MEFKRKESVTIDMDEDDMQNICIWINLLRNDLTPNSPEQNLRMSHIADFLENIIGE